MKKSNKSFDLTVTKDGTTNNQSVGTRSGVANFIRELLGGVQSGSVNINIEVKDAPVSVTPTDTPPAA